MITQEESNDMRTFLSRIFPLGELYLPASFQHFFAILIQDETICRRSVLTQYALSQAVNNITVVFIAPKKFSSLPVSIHGMLEPTPQIMQRIQYLYFSHYKEVVHFLSSIQKNGPLSLLIFDGLDEYFKQIQQEENDSERIFAKFLALIVDTGNYISIKSEKILPIMASYSGMSEISSDIWKMFFEFTWKVEALDPDMQEHFLINISEGDTLQWQIEFSQNYEMPKPKLMLQKISQFENVTD